MQPLLRDLVITAYLVAFQKVDWGWIPVGGIFLKVKFYTFILKKKHIFIYFYMGNL